MMNRGIFVSLEGPDGSGKSTQIEYLKEYFAQRQIDCVFTREPGGTPIGEQIRQVILDRDNREMTDMTEALLYAASRSQHVEQVIRPALERGQVVVCDRYVDSSIAYQAYARGLGDVVAEINRAATGGLAPDITFFIDVDPEVGRSRIASGEQDRLEQERLDFHRRVYEGYRKLAAEEPDRIVTIDGSRSREEMRDQIFSCLGKVLP